MAEHKPVLSSIIDTLRYEIIEAAKKGSSIAQIIPPSTQLMKRFGTTQDTVRRAQERLKAERLILTSGKSTIINAVNLDIPGVTPSFDDFLKDNGLVPHFENVGEPEIITLSDEYAKEFKIPAGSRAVRRLRLQGEIRDSLPQSKTTTARTGKNGSLVVWYRLAETMYQLDLIEQVGGQEWIEEIKSNPRFNIIKEIEKKTGKKITHASSKLVPRFPDRREQELLNISYQTPVIEHWRRCFSEDGTMIMFNRILLVACNFTFEFDYPITL